MGYQGCFQVCLGGQKAYHSALQRISENLELAVPKKHGKRSGYQEMNKTFKTDEYMKQIVMLTTALPIFITDDENMVNTADY